MRVLSHEGSGPESIWRAALEFALGAAFGVLALLRAVSGIVLSAFEPLVVGALAILGVLGILIALFFEYSGSAPNFPFWTVMGFSIGFLVAGACYSAVVAWLTR